MKVLLKCPEKFDLVVTGVKLQRQYDYQSSIFITPEGSNKYNNSNNIQSTIFFQLNKKRLLRTIFRSLNIYF